MTVTLRYAARSDVGLVRSNNQDSAYAGPNLLVVADGMGGHAGGDVASALTIAALVGLDRPDHSSDQSMSELERSIDRARQDLVDATTADPDLAGMGTTVTALLKSGNTLAMAHLGDSRAYLLRDGTLAQVTVDHTFVQHLVDTGRITADEAETHPQRNVVMRVLGDFDLDLTPDLSIREAIPGDRWMLCSDGLSGFVPDDEIAEVLISVTTPQDAVERLVSMSMRAGSTDNITVVVADILDEAAAATTAATVTPEIVGSAALAGVTAAGGDPASPTALPGSDIDGDTVTGFTRSTVPTGGQASPAPVAVSVLPDAVAHDGLADTLEQAMIAGTPDDEQYQPDVQPDDDLDDDADEEETPPKKRVWLTVLGALLLVVGLVLAGWGGYRWTQTQYYVGESDGQVAVFRGIPATAGPLTFSTPVELTGTRVDELPDFVANRVHETIRATSLEDARGRADRLVADATEEPEPTTSPSPTQSPSPTTSKQPGGDSSPSSRTTSADTGQEKNG
ncbi:PP2C family protein-serine/threonine phosphatase [Promicromonospora iranensis]|uniref:Protein phosphatase n=1 Tax=Promicromonospora iranensis TaxID=1105144 RepID=A0ABU2CPM9_9MICO|nr:PP2C family serine/threonine-protein phosphatase [Promicromonospora iranensis]MDR7383278.1 protein phosphatase [Promicromonospora iranensis]